jgi:hypothetical protein
MIPLTGSPEFKALIASCEHKQGARGSIWENLCSFYAKPATALCFAYGGKGQHYRIT